MEKPESTIEISAEAVAKAIADNDDFGLEMKVRALLRDHGAVVQHGWTYIDPVESKPRQFDIRARFPHHSLGRVLHLAVECKNLDPAMPLVISGTARAKDEAFHHYVYAPPEADGKHAKVMSVVAGQAIYPAGEFVGKSIVRLKANKAGLEKAPSSAESEIYNRWTHALASADELCKMAIKPDDHGNLGRAISTGILPVVVIPDQSLWAIPYDANGVAGTPTQVNETTLFLNHEVTIVPKNLWLRFSHVHFFTLTGLRGYSLSSQRESTLSHQTCPASLHPHWLRAAFVLFRCRSLGFRLHTLKVYTRACRVHSG